MKRLFTDRVKQAADHQAIGAEKLADRLLGDPHMEPLVQYKIREGLKALLRDIRGESCTISKG